MKGANKLADISSALRTHWKRVLYGRGRERAATCWVYGMAWLRDSRTFFCLPDPG